MKLLIAQRMTQISLILIPCEYIYYQFGLCTDFEITHNFWICCNYSTLAIYTNVCIATKMFCSVVSSSTVCCSFICLHFDCSNMLCLISLPFYTAVFATSSKHVLYKFKLGTSTKSLL